jgi:hypothetical protein
MKVMNETTTNKKVRKMMNNDIQQGEHDVLLAQDILGALGVLALITVFIILCIHVF